MSKLRNVVLNEEGYIESGRDMQKKRMWDIQLRNVVKIKKEEKYHAQKLQKSQDVII